MVHRIVRKIEQSRSLATEYRARRDNAATTLRAAGYTSTELAEQVSVQSSRIRQYVTAGSDTGGYSTVQDFVDAFQAWEDEDARLIRLRDQRNQMILAELKEGRTQIEVGKEFGMSQFQVSHITRHNTAVTLF